MCARLILRNPDNQNHDPEKPKMRKRKKIAQTKTEIYISFTSGLRFFRQSCVIVMV